MVQGKEDKTHAPAPTYRLETMPRALRARVRAPILYACSPALTCSPGLRDIVSSDRRGKTTNGIRLARPNGEHRAASQRREQGGRHRERRVVVVVRPFRLRGLIEIASHSPLLSACRQGSERVGGRAGGQAGIERNEHHSNYPTKRRGGVRKEEEEKKTKKKRLLLY